MRRRLRNSLHWWLSWCDSSFIISILAKGYWLPWKGEEPTPFEALNHAGVQAHMAFTQGAVSDLIASGAAVQVSSKAALTCISPLNVVEQRDKCRLILDLRKVNAHLQVPKFKYEGLGRVTEIIRPNDWMFTIDLKSGYHHVEIHSSCWRYLGFQLDGKFYCFTSLPFGLATAPFVFTQLIKQLAKRWRARGVRVILYVDDLLFLCHSETQARSTCIKVLQDLKAAGFVINAKKSNLHPTHHLRFLGMELDTERGMFLIGEDRREQLLQELHLLVKKGQSGRQVPIRKIARITGFLSSMLLALGTTARAFSHELLHLIDSARSWNARVKLSQVATEELLFWTVRFDRFNGAPFHQSQRFDAVIHVDASAHSWGAILAKFPSASCEASACMPRELLRTSNTRRELEGVLWALQTFATQVAGAHVLVRVDNQAVMFILRKGGSRQADLTLTCQAIIQFCLGNTTRLAIEWIPRELNVQADDLSKLQDHDNYSLHAPWFRLLDRHWGPHTIDLFANARNKHVQRFCSKIPHPDAFTVDAFSISWKGERCFAFPPPHLVPATLRHAELTHAELTLVVPQWTGASWWPLLQPSTQAWAPAVVAHLAIAQGGQCLRAGSHTTAFSGLGLPHSPIIALRVNYAI
ncbi:unnamed protein product [Closterium sp. NIES-53]